MPRRALLARRFLPALRRMAALAACGVVGLSGCSLPDRALRVGAGYTARVMCSLVFHSGLSPERAFDDYISSTLGAASVFASYEVDFDERSVTGHGLHATARAIWRDGVGCTLVAGASEAALRAVSLPARRPLQPSPWPNRAAALSGEARARIDEALSEAFAQPADFDALRQTTAVVAIHGGAIVAERYAPGIDASTRLMSWSMAKSVTAALLGIAVREERLDIHAPAPVAEWRTPGDPRGGITLDHLLRMSSGLAFDEHYGAVNDVSVMLFTRADTGAFAANKELEHEVDAFWSYSSGTSNIVARVLRDAFAGDLAALVAWSNARLFDAIGMQSAVFETDASGSFVGSSFVFATARDWARFGELHLRDGVWAGQRVLPEGWVDYVRTPTPKAERGVYGAHWWLNAGAPHDPADRTWPTLPTDAYAARGMSGQYVIVIPSADLVVVRLGLTQSEADDLTGIEPLVAKLLEALAPETQGLDPR